MITISIELLEEIAREVAGRVRTDYSGRGMFGDTCIGITTTPHRLLELGAVISRLVNDEALREELTRNSNTDSMGYDTIVYWARVTCSDVEEDEEE